MFANVKIMLMSFVLTFFCSVAACNAQTMPIKVGVTLPLSGPLAYYGDSQRKGVELAAKEINKGGGISGHPVQLIIEDNKFDAKSEVLSVQKLINVDRVHAIITAWTPMTEPIIPSITASKTPTFTWMAFEVGERSQYLFNMLTEFPVAATKAVKSICQRKIKKAVLLSVESYESDPVDKAVIDAGNQCDVSITKIKFDSNTSDFKTFLTKAKALNSGALIVFAYPNQFPLVVKQISQVGMHGIKLFDVGAGGPDKVVSKGLEEHFSELNTVSVWYSVNPAFPPTKRFVDSISETYPDSKDIEAYAALSYDAMGLLAKSFEKCGLKKDNSKCVVDNLLTIRNYTGAAGIGNMDSDGDYHLPMELVEFKNGKFEFLSTAN